MSFNDIVEAVSCNALYSKVNRIVTCLDADGNGFMDESEIKVLIAKMAGLNVWDIEGTHKSHFRPIAYF